MSNDATSSQYIVAAGAHLGAGASAAIAASLYPVAGLLYGAVYMGVFVSVVHLSSCAGDSTAAKCAKLFIAAVLASAIPLLPLALAGHAITLTTAGLLAGSQAVVVAVHKLIDCCCSEAPEVPDDSPPSSPRHGDQGEQPVPDDYEYPLHRASSIQLFDLPDHVDN